jgi:hypothetical protein
MAAGPLERLGRHAALPRPDPQRTPLRELFRECNDEVTHTLIKNYFTAVERTLWRDAAPQGYIRKTVGIQALFDLAKPLLHAAVQSKDLRVASFEERLSAASHVDFSAPLFQASGTGRTHIRKTLEFALQIGSVEILQDDPNIDDYRRLLAK